MLGANDHDITLYQRRARIPEVLPQKEAHSVTYSVGDSYRYIDRVRNGVPHYVDTKIRTIHPPAGDSPGFLFLENNEKVQIIGTAEQR